VAADPALPLRRCGPWRFSDGLTIGADNSAMGAIGAAIALAQYAAILTAIGALARLSLQLAVRGVELWQEDAVGPEQEVL
jgi:hypothetical protein